MSVPNINCEKMLTTTPLKLITMVTVAGFTALITQPSKALIFRPNGFTINSSGFYNLEIEVEDEVKIEPVNIPPGKYERAIKNFNTVFYDGSFFGGGPAVEAKFSLSHAVDLEVICCQTRRLRIDPFGEPKEDFFKVAEYSFDFLDEDLTISKIESDNSDIVISTEKVSGKFSFIIPTDISLEEFGKSRVQGVSFDQEVAFLEFSKTSDALFEILNKSTRFEQPRNQPKKIFSQTGTFDVEPSPRTVPENSTVLATLVAISLLLIRQRCPS